VAVKVHVIHENPDWYGPFARAFDAEGVPHEQWLLGEGVLDLDATPPPGVFWSRMSASAHTRGHPLAKDHTRAVLCWLEAHGRRVVNGRRVLELEMSKADQLTALRAAGFDVPRTLAVAGRDELASAAKQLGAPFISKHNQGGKGLGVQRFDSHEEFAAHVSSGAYVAPVDGITLLQEYVQAAAPFITRVEVVGGEFLYAITADTARGGFTLCPADACAVDEGPAEPSLFALRDGFDDPIIGRYLDFARRHGIEIAGFEFIEAADGKLVTYDVNTTTNYNAEIEAAAPRSGPRETARYLRRLLDEEPGQGA
jgi:glutathione synthase/RimK-type ligase-like ATP-grasp enzyme